MNFSDNRTVAGDSSDFQSPYYKEAQWAQILRLALYVLIASLGVAGNVIVCLVITFQPQMHTIINYFVRNLAIADLGILLISFPFAIVKEQDPYHWPLGEFLCRCVFPLSDLFFGVSVWSITLIAVDRHRAIVRGVLPKRSSTVFKSARWMVVCVWILSFLIISVPQYVVMDFFDYRPDFNITDCTQRWPNEEDGDEMRQVYFMSLTVFCYVLPLTIVVGTFHSISRKLRASNKFNRTIREDYGKIDEQRHRKRLRERQNSKAKKLLIPVVIAFAVTMLPLNVFRLVVLYWKEIAQQKYLWVYFNICVFFVIVNSSINFFIYSLVSDEFRQGFKRFFSWNTGEISNAQSVTEPRVPRSSLSPLSPVDLGNINRCSLNERDD